MGVGSPPPLSLKHESIPSVHPAVWASITRFQYSLSRLVAVSQTNSKIKNAIGKDRNHLLGHEISNFTTVYINQYFTPQRRLDPGRLPPATLLFFSMRWVVTLSATHLSTHLLAGVYPLLNSHAGKPYRGGTPLSEPMGPGAATAVQICSVDVECVRSASRRPL